MRLQQLSWRKKASAKNKEDKMVNSQQVEALVVTRGRSTEPSSSGRQRQGRSKSKSKKNFKCYNCGKKGHLKKDCWNLKDFKSQENVTSTSVDGIALCNEAVTTGTYRKKFSDVWILETVAT